MNKEQIYDEKIAPLMQQVLEICMANNIAMISDFEIPNDEDPHLCCTSNLPGDDGLFSQRHLPARRALLSGSSALAFTTMLSGNA
jgi:hypothetical protein